MDFGLRDAVSAPAVLAAQPELWAYAAPELIKGAAPTESTDVFALGAILFELGIGQPFPSKNGGYGETELALRKLAAVPGGMGRVIASLLSADAAARPAAIKTATLLRQTLDGKTEVNLPAELGALVQRLSQQEPRPPSDEASDAVI